MSKKTKKHVKMDPNMVDTLLSESTINDYLPDFPRSPRTIKKTSKETTQTSEIDKTDLLISSIKLRLNLQETFPNPVKPKLSLLERGLEKKKKRQQAFEDKKVESQALELQNCTFKPAILSRNQVSESGTIIIKRCSSGELIKNNDTLISKKE